MFTLFILVLCTLHILCLFLYRYFFLKMDIREGMSNIQVPLRLVLKTGTAEVKWNDYCNVTIRPWVICGQVASYHLGLTKYICRIHKATTTTESFPTLKVDLQDEGGFIWFMICEKSRKLIKVSLNCRWKRHRRCPCFWLVLTVSWLAIELGETCPRARRIT